MQTVMPLVTLREGTKAGEVYSYGDADQIIPLLISKVTFIGDTNGAQLQPLTASLNPIVAGNSTGVP